MANVVNRRINIYIDQDSALSAQAKLQAAFDKSSQRVKKLEAAGKDATAEIAKMGKLRGKLEEINGVVDGRLRPSFNLVKKTVADLRRELKGMSQDAPGYAEKFNRFQAANKQFTEMKKNIGGVRSSMRSLASDIKGVALGVLVGNTIQGAIQQIGRYVSGIVQGNARLSDSLADIQRVAGLTKEQVDELYGSLRQLDTRTSTSGLLNIAVIAGKLGVEGVQNISDFVAATDKLQVALGDELGNADEITTQLGKIINVYGKGEKVTGDALLHIGNAVVDLANKGVATGGFIVDFTQRLSGLKGIADLALPSVLGLAAGLEESGQRVESSSTAVIRTVSLIASDVPKAARLAGKSIEEFANTLNTKPLEALLQFATGLQKNKQGLAEVTKAFDEAGADGTRVITTLGVLGAKADFFREKMNDAGTAMQGTNEIMDAFSLKNETLGAELDKLGKKFYKLITSSGIKDFMTGLIHFTSGLIDVLISLGGFLKDNAKAFGLLTAAIVVNHVALKKSKIALLAYTTATKAARASSLLFAAAQALITGNITRFRAALKLLTGTISLNPLGALLAAAGALYLLYNNLIKKTHELTAAQRVQQDVSKKVNDATVDQISKVQTLVNIINDNKIALDRRKQALQDLIKINPTYLHGLTLENAATKKGKELIDDYIASLKKKAKAEALAEVRTENLKEEINAQADLKKAREDLNTTAGRLSQQVYLQQGIRVGPMKRFLDAQERLKDAKENIKYIDEVTNAQIEADAAVQAFQAKLQHQYDVLTGNAKKTADTVKTTNDEIVDSEKDKNNKIKSDQERLIQFLKNQNLDLDHFYDNEIQKRLYAIQQKYEKELALAHGNAELLKEIERTKNRELALIGQEYIQKIANKLQQGRTNLPGNYTLPDFVPNGNDNANAGAAGAVARYGEPDQNRLQKEQQTRQQILQQGVNGLQSILGSYYNFQQNAAYNELELERQINEKKKKELADQLRHKEITQRQYNRKVAALDESLAKKQTAIRLKQFKEAQAMQVIQAIMSGAQAIISTLAARPGFMDAVTFGTLRAVQIALVAATTAAQVALIASQKPPSFGEGGKLSGPKHNSRYNGMPVINPETGRVYSYLEGGEGILKASAMNDEKSYTVTGTPSQITSSLNAVHGGRAWTSGATITPHWLSARPRQMNIPNIQQSLNTIKMYATGGVFKAQEPAKTEVIMPQNTEPSEVFISHGQFEALLNAFDKKLKAYVSLSDLQTQQDRLEKIKDNATLR